MVSVAESDSKQMQQRINTNNKLFFLTGPITCSSNSLQLWIGSYLRQRLPTTFEKKILGIKKTYDSSSQKILVIKGVIDSEKDLVNWSTPTGHIYLPRSANFT